MALVRFDSNLHKKLPRYDSCIVCGGENDFGLKTWFFTDFEFVYNNCLLDKHYIGYPERIHGGIVSAILDETMGWVATVKTNHFYYTVELCIKYKNIAKPNTELFTKAQFLALKGKIALTQAVIYSENEQIIATAKGKYYPLNPKDQNYVESLLTKEY
ncbi:MAG TPA: PaaI family thioesterase [Desulfurella acetivorans]|uniref:PaaI family thioesterase n=1 Tax=Desulfurella acetivorans TaxID=33002 RepID=A0A7C6A6Z2_DESAE|nr:PaaI family thioesterase [Desulfurella acetivorans]